MIPPAAFGAIAVALYAGHYIGDHWVQLHTWAVAKASPGRAGHLACLAHVATYTATCIAAVLAAAALTGIGLAPAAVAAGALVNAVTHYAADRKTFLAWLARATGHAGYWTLGVPRPGRDDPAPAVTGATQLDQAWHLGWLAVVAAITAGGATIT